MKAQFIEFKEQLKGCYLSEDIENSHMIADNILCEIAISAAESKLSVKEVKNLISVYNDISKWYA